MSKWKAQRNRIKTLAKARIADAAREERITDDACVALAAVSYASETRYLQTQLPTGRRFLTLHATASGYDAAALIHSRTRTLVILNRGTEWSEKEDLIQNVAAILSGEDYGQIEDALAFMGQMWTQNQARVDEIKVIGHSLGGGLAEAQVCLGASAMRKAGLSPPRDIFGIGVASAGYKRPIEDLAQRRGYDINRDASDITHYVREHDVIQDILLRDRFGSVTWRGSIYQATLKPNPGPRPGNRWEPFAEAIHNHDCSTYFEQFDVRADQHVVWRWKALKYEVRDGEKPENYPNFQVPKTDI